MLLNFLELVQKFNIKSTGIIQIGAHYGQEYSEYVKAGIDKMVFIEPCEKAFTELSNRLSGIDGILLFKCACGEVKETRVMFTGSQNEGQSNSLLRMDKHLQIHPGITLEKTEIVNVERLDDLPIGHVYNTLNMDCQGFEGWVLKGGMNTLKHIDYVYTEINFDSVYENCTKSDELDLLLSDFERVQTGVKVGGMWSDALYIRKKVWEEEKK